MLNDFDIEEACSELRALLDEAIKCEDGSQKQAVASKAVGHPNRNLGLVRKKGVLLSGGLDTSIIAFLAKRHVPHLKAFTVTLEGFDEDLKYAKRVAQFLDLEHRVHFFSKRELMEAASAAAGILSDSRYETAIPPHIKESIVEGYSELVGPTTIAPLYIAMRFAKGYVDSIYTGDGADELFIGYDSITAFIDLIASSGDEPLARDLERELSSRVFQAYDLRYPYMLGQALGLEVKAPYLTLEVSEFARKIPVEHKVRAERGEVWGKWLLRKAFEDYLPPEIVWRKKTTIDSGTGAIGVWR